MICYYFFVQENKELSLYKLVRNRNFLLTFLEARSLRFVCRHGQVLAWLPLAFETSGFRVAPAVVQRGGECALSLYSRTNNPTQWHAPS